jgi:hypothetical protein
LQLFLSKLDDLISPFRMRTSEAAGLPGDRTTQPSLAD